MNRSKLAPLQRATVRFSGRYDYQDPRGNILLKKCRIDGRAVKHLWLNSQYNDTVTAPVGSLISGYAEIFQYTRNDGSKEMGLTNARDLEVSW